MSANTTTLSTTARVARSASIVLVVAVASVILGGATSFAQGGFLGPLAPFANSSSGWTLLTALVVWSARRGAGLSGLLGAVSFIALIEGYILTSHLRGIVDSETFFLVAAVVVGPFVGVAASWLHRKGRRAALGIGLLSGIGIGDAANGLATLVPYTGWFYWALIGVIAIALLVVVLGRQVREPLDRVLGILVTLLVAGAFVGAFFILNGSSV
ncbi:DUF6518 family protein [Cryobacterium roopkundense]|uniref:Major facilitator superfamily (MFS) profile domain-containing protein n=1 Tax=Cryobacterium roopkundense TaxID=1001240 RepID=A0A7W8ZYT8_9MICO|nr:DUF6518 family protein [Cryobacterium roopkundense]MBB5642723.1 hypothetical protein [Cryobacterium roopkundense]